MLMFNPAACLIPSLCFFSGAAIQSRLKATALFRQHGKVSQLCCPFPALTTSPLGCLNSAWLLGIPPPLPTQVERCPEARSSPLCCKRGRCPEAAVLWVQRLLQGEPTLSWGRWLD